MCTIYSIVFVSVYIIIPVCLLVDTQIVKDINVYETLSVYNYKKQNIMKLSLTRFDYSFLVIPSNY